jgi:hypothetical protein
MEEQLQEILKQKFPKANFRRYFDFLEQVVVLVKGGHRHHILPKNEFPELKNDPRNLVRISPAEHYLAHYLLAIASPEFELAFFLMSSYRSAQIDRTQLSQFAQIYERGRFKQIQASKETCQKLIKDPRHREWASAGGKTGAGGRKNVELHGPIIGTRMDRIKGAHRRNELYGNPATQGSRAKGGKRGGHIRWHVKRGIVAPGCELCPK